MSLLERELYVHGLTASLDGVSRGTGCVTLVCGEAGIGKTSLIHEFVDGQRSASRVLWGSCEALFTPHPLAPLYDIARQAGADFQAAITATSKREVIFNATVDQLARGPMPAIVIFEDVHWADEATLDLIKFLGRRLQRLGVMLIVTYRDDEVGPSHPLRSVIGDLPTACLRRISLPPLTEAGVAILAGNAGREPMGLHLVTGGNPFFVTEALAMAPDARVPATVRDAVIARIARLSAAARAIANLVAIVPGRTERWLLEKTVDTAAAALEECLGAGMVFHADNSVAFRHELARRAVEESLPMPLRQTLHTRVLAALLGQTATDIPVARVVHHADKAGDAAVVLRFAPAAAESASELGAHGQAAAHFTTALAHAGALPGVARAELLDGASYECYLTDQVVAAIAAREESLALWRAAGSRLKEGDSLRWLSRLTWFAGNKEAADKYAIKAVETLEPLPPGRELAMAYSNRSQLCMLSAEVDGTLLWGNKAITLAIQLRDSGIESHALNNVGTARLGCRDPAGRGDLERSLRLALDGGFQEHAARAWTNLASTAVRMCDLAAAKSYLTAGIAYCETRDLSAWERYMIALRAETRLAQGDWRGATDDAEAILRHPRVAAVIRIPALIAVARVRARRGDPGVQELLDEAYALAMSAVELQRVAPAVVLRAEVAWLSGDSVAAAVAADDVGRCYELAQKQFDHWTISELAFWLWRASRLSTAPALLAEPYALQIAGDWAGAASAWEALGCPYERAIALADSTQENALRRALEIFEALGAIPAMSLVRRRLRARGVRGIPRGAQERTRQNPHGLTNRELHVLAFLAEGLRNSDIAGRLFLSEKTVDHHVSAVLAKLDVRSRGEAAAVANQLGLGPPAARGRPAKT